MPSSTTKLHILSLKKNLKNNKHFLKSISKCKTEKKCKNLSKSELTVLQHLLSAFVRGEIEVTKQFHSRIKKTRKYNLITQHFAKINSKKTLRDNLLQIASALPIFIKIILKKPSVPKT